MLIFLALVNEWGCYFLTDATPSKPTPQWVLKYMLFSSLRCEGTDYHLIAKIHYNTYLINNYFKSPKQAISEIINLQAISNLPKGTEHFLSDLHGEADTFIHILKNASGVIRLKLEAVFKNYMTNLEIQDLLTLIYYPEESLKLISRTEKDMDGWYKKTLLHLIRVLKEISSKYTRSKVRKALPQDYAYIMDELINMSVDASKESYYENILSSIIELGEGDNFIIALCQVIQRLAIDHLHIVGDIFDRGKGADVIMDRLMSYHSLDIQWGNHDVLWIGASLGNAACIANVIRINCKYKNLGILESAYGINLRALETFAIKHYKDDDCNNFEVKNIENDVNPFDDEPLLSKMHKAERGDGSSFQDFLERKNRPRRSACFFLTGL